METITDSWSWGRFYIVWHWFRRSVDVKESEPLAQYYCQQLWQWNTPETLLYIPRRVIVPARMTMPIPVCYTDFPKWAGGGVKRIFTFPATAQGSIGAILDADTTKAVPEQIHPPLRNRYMGIIEGRASSLRIPADRRS
ncbi:hypothetical protein F4861DRAFT_542587 [Xylaria intraflava]|nr:hypothetical protein F4861DRAFT_542587 [Xylaria intraflava]